MCIRDSLSKVGASDKPGAVQIDHFFSFRDDLGAATEASEEVADVAVILLNGDGEVLTGRQLCGGNQAMVACSAPKKTSAG